MLPIYDVKDSIIHALKDNKRLILSAPTGSGKSTQVPQIMLDSGTSERILVLQPRRLAAIMLADRVAEERGSEAGKDVGYITRFDKAYSNDTSICFITTGILPRMLLDNPELRGWDTVVFDEFHERSALQDVSLSLLRELQKKREDLKLVVMSATLDPSAILEYLPNTEHIEAEGRTFPVENFYEPPRAQQPIWEAAKKSLVNTLNRGDGDILIFMPGAFEIHKTIEECKKISCSQELEFLPLYGSLPHDQQQKIMHPDQSVRRVIVATNIAETSLTIPGVRHVIDCGLAKVNRFHPGRGVNSLETEPITMFSADQRSGRAGRTAPGTCTRLWRKNGRPEGSLDPEVKRIDLAETLLLIMQFGFHDPFSFPWFTKPRPSACNAAMELLSQLGFTDSDKTLTKEGVTAAMLPVHPRMAKMLMTAEEQNCVPEASLAAALLSERPILLGGKNRLRKLAAFFDTKGETVASKKRRPRLAEAKEEMPVSDLDILIQAMLNLSQSRFNPNLCQQMGISRGAAISVWRSFEHIISACKKNRIDIKLKGDFVGLAKSLLSAYYDRIACRRDNSSPVCYTTSGRADLSPESIVAKSNIFISTDFRKNNSGTALLYGNCEMREEWINEIFPEAFTIEEKTEWNDVNQRVEKHHTVKCLDVVFEDKLVKDDAFLQECGDLLAEGIIKKKLVLPTWDKDVKNWVSRVRWLAETFPERDLITYDFEDYQCIMEEFCAGENSYHKVRSKPIMPYVKNVMSWEDQQFVEQMAPERIQLPNGKRLRILYRPGTQPQGRARIQELYDLTSNPIIANGRVKVILQILGPNMRPVQVTEDINSFWQNLYPQIRKQLSRRYPRHEWR